MRFITALLRWLSALLFHFSIFFVIGSFSFVFLLGNSQTVKDLLVESGIYNKFVNSVIEANLEQPNANLNTLPLDDENIQNIINRSFSPQSLKDQTEDVVDDAYSWLDGSSESLAFTYDFTDSKDAMNNGIAEYSANRVLSLPECATISAEVNVFTIDCKPPGFSFEFVRTQLLADLQSSDFLATPIYTEESLNNADGVAFESQYSYAPIIFQLLQGSIYISILLSLLLAAFFVYVRRPYARAFQALGRDLLSNGFMIVLLTAVFGFLIPRYTDAFAIQGDGTSALFNQVSNLYIERLDIIVINVAIQIAAVGLGIILMVRINKTAGGYRAARVNSGLITSIAARKPSQRPDARSKRPPVQTSEVEKSKKSRKSAKKKKRKISTPGA